MSDQHAHNSEISNQIIHPKSLFKINPAGRRLELHAPIAKLIPSELQSELHIFTLHWLLWLTGCSYFH